MKGKMIMLIQIDSREVKQLEDEITSLKSKIVSLSNELEWKKSNSIILELKNGKYLSIIQFDNGQGELSILGSNKQYVDDGTFEYGIKRFDSTLELASELLKLNLDR